MLRDDETPSPLRIRSPYSPGRAPSIVQRSTTPSLAVVIPPDLSTSSFTKQQWLIIIMFAFVNFCSAVCFSLMAPFFPEEAMKKGASPTIYGFVLGVYEITNFIMSPIYGRYFNRIGAKFLFNAGILVTGVTNILFGFLEDVPSGFVFVFLCFVVRIISAMGTAAYMTASFAIITCKFPDAVATTIGVLETFIGLGFMIGPTIGGALYLAGGFKVPFITVGIVLLVAAGIIFIFLPPIQDDPQSENGSYRQLLKIPSVVLAACCIAIMTTSLGFLGATLEPHLHQFNLSPVLLGLMFFLSGSMYAISAPLWGKLTDKKGQPKLYMMIGCVLMIFAYIFMGPLPWLPFDTYLWVVAITLIAHGIGMGAQLVPPFIDALKSAIAEGFPESSSTYALISSLWSSMVALGSFIGPVLGGILLDTIGFRKSTSVILSMHVALLIAIMIYVLVNRRNNREDSQGLKETEPLLRSPSAPTLYM